MTACSSYAHPQVPKTVLSVMMSYCHSCQSWTRFMWSATMVSEKAELWHDDSSVEYGPFDASSLVLDELLTEIARQWYAPGRPWDTGQWAQSGPKDAAELGDDA
jgi:hypothetical protein